MNNEETQVEVTPEQEPELEITLEDETPAEVATDTPSVDWQKEALKYKAIAQRYAKKVQGGSPAPKQDLTEKKDDDIRLTVKELQMAEKKRQFGYEHGLSPEETDAVFKLTPNPTKEVLEDPFVKGGLASLRAKKRVAENTPSSSSRSASFKLTKKEEMSSDEKQKAFEEHISKRLGR
jgi:hypothetical protein